MAYHRNGVRLPSYDARDFVFEPAAPGLEDAGSTATAELSVPFPPWHQGNGASDDVPCCVSCSVVTAMEVLDAQEEPHTRLSALFHYYEARTYKERLTGLELREGLRTAVKSGVCALGSHLPMSADGRLSREDALKKPFRAAYENAERRRIAKRNPRRRRSYCRIGDPQDPALWRAAISSGKPVVFVFPVTSAYERLAHDGDVHAPVFGHPIGASFHAVCAFGYDGAQGLHIRDSRGMEFGSGGDWWMPWSLITQPWFVQDAWVIGAITY